MTNVKKKGGKRFGAIVLSLILLLSLVFPYPVMADQTAADQTTAASVYAIHKTGDDKENFVIVIMGEGYTREQQEQATPEAALTIQEVKENVPAGYSQALLSGSRRRRMDEELCTLMQEVITQVHAKDI